LKNNKAARSVVLILGIVLVVIMLASMFANGNNAAKADELTYTEFIQKVKEQQVDRVSVTDRTLVGLYAGDMSRVATGTFPARYDFYTTIPSMEVLQQDLLTIAAEAKGIEVNKVTFADITIGFSTQEPQETSIWVQLIPFLIMALLSGGLIFLFMRQMQGANKSAMNFAKSRARLADEKNKVTFRDVAGADEEKEELVEIVEFLKNPKRFLELGARIPKGVLLVGPPGTGKTLLAKAVAGEAGVPFYSISGSDFVEMYVGVGASRVRDLFEQAKKAAPAIVFIDEIDAVGRQRGAGLGGGHDEREQTLNQLLVEMDGFSPNEGIIVVSATNRPDILDPALTRPGRFDRQITVNYPDVRGREAILKVHSRGKPLDEDVDLERVAKLTPYFTGADLENVLNEAALLSARRSRKKIPMSDIAEAITRVELGPEKRSHKVTDKDRKLVAYHESGHAMVAWAMPACDPLQEISIIPRGSAGGYTQTFPKEESDFVTKAKLLDDIAMSLGGYMAEQLVMGDITTGSSSDIRYASARARKMVTEWGMSDDIGPVFLGGQQEVFIGRDYGQTHSYSETLSAQIDAEVHRILEDARTRAEEVLSKYMDKLHIVASTLLDREKITGNEFEILMKGGSLDAPSSAPDDKGKPEAKPTEAPKQENPGPMVAPPADQPAL